MAHVKYLDFTGSAWPVGTAHVDWDQAYNIDVDWVVADSSSACGADCATVRALSPSEDPFGRFGPNCTGWAGYWVGYLPDANNHWQDPLGVRFNKSCNDKPARYRRALVCQELGHGLGLDHAAVTSSCMFENAAEAEVDPRAHDYDMLNTVIYDH